MYGNFDIVLVQISRVSQLHITQHAPCAMLYFVPMLIGSRLGLGIRCSDRFMSSGNQNGVTFTSLREPVDRVLSGYKFEGRWKLRTLHYAWMDSNRLVTNDKIDRTEHEFVDAAEKSSALTRAIGCQIDTE